MARLFPFRSETETGKRMPRIVGIEDENADAVFKALSSETAREIYATLGEEPGTPSDVAEAVDSSIQNVRYHLEKLEDAGLIEVVDTWYSSRGNEMSVYATANGPLIVTSDPSAAERLKAALSRYLGGVAVLAGGSALVYYGLDRMRGAWPGPILGGDDADDGGDTGPAEDTANGDEGGGAGNGANGDANGGANGDDANGNDSEENGDDGNETTDDGLGNETTTDGDSGNESTADEELGNESTTDDAVDPADGSGSVDDFAGGNDAVLEFGGGEAGVDRSVATESGGNGFYADVTVVDGTGAVDGAEAVEVALALVPPGMLFFLASVVAITAMTGYAYWTAK